MHQSLGDVMWSVCLECSEHQGNSTHSEDSPGDEKRCRIPTMDLKAVNLFVLCLCAALPQSESFNIDLETATVYRGSSGSGFGYTAEFVRHKPTGKVSLLVGAPKENVTDRSNSGLHYDCDPATAGPLCAKRNAPPQLGSLSRDGLFGEDEENFGLAMTLADEYTAVTCGPLWSDLRWFHIGYDFDIGRCQILPSEGNPGLTPYRDKTKYLSELQLGGGTSKQMLYGRAQFGFSADGNGDGRVVIGAPGFSVARGGVVVLDTKFLNFTLMTNILDPDPYVVLGYAVAVGNFCGPKRFCFAVSNRQVQGKVYLLEYLSGTNFRPLMSMKGKQEYSSFGSVLCAVDVTGDGWADLLVGAPTFTLFTNTTSYYDQGRVLVYISQGEVRSGQENFREGTALNGAGLKFSRFGSAISSIGDINRDSINDIAVGAPMEEGGAGVVYVYLGSRDGPANKFSQKIRGKGFTPPLASFGTHIAKPTSHLSDYGYPDFAVGAPTSSAVVFLKTRLIVNAHGSVEATPNPVEKTNRLCPSVLSRTETGCVNVTLCLKFTYSAAGLTQSAKAKFRSLSFDVHLEVDKLINTDGSRRVRLYNPEDGTTTTSLHLPLTVTRTSPLCQQYLAVLKQDQINRNPFKPVQLEARFSLNTTAFPGIAPMLNQSMPDSVTHQLRFKNQCGQDQVCVTDLVLTGHVMYVPTNDDYQLNVVNETTQVELVLNVLNRGETSFGMMLSVNLTGPMDFWTATGMLCEARHDSLLHCEGWAPLGNSEAVQVRIKFLADSLPLEPQNRRVTFEVKVTPSDPAENPESNMADNVLSLESQTAIVADVRLDGSATPSVTHVADSDQADVSLTHKLLVTNRGPSFLPPTTLLLTLPFLDSTASNILHSSNVTIKQEGGAVLECPQLLDKESAHGTDTTTASSASTTSRSSPSPTTTASGGGGVGTTPSGGGSGGRTTTDDPFGGGVGEVSKRRRREAGRAAQEQGAPVAARAAEEDGRTRRMDCDSYQCRTYKCPLTTLQANQRAEVNVAVTLRRSAIAFPGNVDSLFYVTTTSVVQPDLALFYRWSEPKRREVRTQMKRISGGDEINIWYIIGGLIGGLLLLVIIVLIAWRCGFFKRKNKAKLEKLKRQSGFYDSNRSMKKKGRASSSGSAPDKE
ncbi:integrin alpha-IIb-like isoform X2 [Babylonia areolata]|uniref:integrin alpha-IIb-like isoform X2 n=1 Tax=Babylonia areolata TaxID=304850 RepID=UPI003FCF88D6